MERLRKRREYRDGLWFIVDLDPSRLTGPQGQHHHLLPATASHLLAVLKRLANRRDVPYQSLFKVFLAERLEAVAKAEK